MGDKGDRFEKLKYSCVENLTSKIDPFLPSDQRRVVLICFDILGAEIAALNMVLEDLSTRVKKLEGKSSLTYPSPADVERMTKKYGKFPYGDLAKQKADEISGRTASRMAHERHGPWPDPPEDNKSRVLWDDGICKSCGSTVVECSTEIDEGDYMNRCTNKDCEEHYWHGCADDEFLEYYEHKK
jgi:hypothetical protein